MSASLKHPLWVWPVVVLAHAMVLWTIHTLLIKPLATEPELPPMMALLPEAPPLARIEPKPVVKPKVVPPKKVEAPKPVITPAPVPVPVTPVAVPADHSFKVEAAPPSPPPPAPAAPVVERQPPPPKIEQPSADASYLRNPRPPYPPVSKRMGEEGTVILRVRIEPDGSASSVLVAQSSGYERLDQSALNTVLTWKFVPGTKNGVPEAMWYRIPIQFSLE